MVGIGVMGRGIALSFAGAGIKTTVMTRNPEKAAELLKDSGAAIAVTSALPEKAPLLVLETIPEKLQLKVDLYQRVEAQYGAAGPIIASNTSSLSLQSLADTIKHTERFCGVHYFQPADVSAVVEFSRVKTTSDNTAETVIALLRQCKKEVVVLSSPIQGLLINRLQHALYREAWDLIEKGVVSAADVDIAAKMMLAPRMCVTGLVEQKDIAGLDTHSLSGESIVPDLCSRPSFSPMVSGMREGGTIGVKSGTGFYDWASVDTDKHQAKNKELLGAIYQLVRGFRQEQALPIAPPLAARPNGGAGL